MMSNRDVPSNRTNKLPVVVATCFGTIALAALLMTFGDSTSQAAKGDLVAGADTAKVEFQIASLEATEAAASSARDAVSPPAEDTSPLTEVPMLETELAQASDDLEAFSLMSLDGVMHVNDALDRMLEFASLPVSAHPDLAYQDSDVLAYKLKGVPQGDEARILIAREPYFEDGKEFGCLQLEVEVDSGTTEFMHGVVRENTTVEFSIGYDVLEPDKPTRFAMMIQRPVDIAGCRDSGIDAYHGSYTSGSYFWIDLLNDPHNPTSGTVGFVDAAPAGIFDFGGVSPLGGDLYLDPERLAAMLAQLQVHLNTIKGD